METWYQNRTGLYSVLVIVTQFYSRFYFTDAAVYYTQVKSFEIAGRVTKALPDIAYIVGVK